MIYLLRKVLMVGNLFLVEFMTLFLKDYRLDRRRGLNHLGKIIVLSKWELLWRGWGIKRFSLIFSKVGVEPNYSDEKIGVFCCELKFTGGGAFFSVLPESLRGGDVEDEGMLNWTRGVIKFLFRHVWIICRSIWLFGFRFGLCYLVLFRPNGNVGWIL